MLHSVGTLLKTIVFDILQLTFNLCFFIASCRFSTFYFSSSSLSASITVLSANIVTCIWQLFKPAPPLNMGRASFNTLSRYMLNSQGDMGHPCPTPLCTSNQSVISFSTFNVASLSLYSPLTAFSSLPSSPYCFNASHSPVLHSISYALSRSRKAAYNLFLSLASSLQVGVPQTHSPCNLSLV